MDRVDMRLMIRHNLSELVYDDPADPDYDATKSGNFWKDSFINEVINDGIRKFSREERWDWLWQVRTNILVPKNSALIALESDIESGRHAYLTLWEAKPWTNVTAYVLNDKVFHNGVTWRALRSNTGVTPVEGLDWTYDTTIPFFSVTKVSPGEGLRLRNTVRQTPGQPEIWFSARSEEVAGTDTARKMTATLVPTPGIDYAAELYYIGNPKVLTLDSAEPDIPEVYQPAIVAWATMRCWVKELNSGKANEQLGIYESILEDARRELKKAGAGEKITWGRPASTTRRSDRDWYARHIPRTIGV